MIGAIRAAVADDIPALVDLQVASWRDAYRGLMPDGFLDGDLLANRKAFWARKWATRHPEDLILLSERPDVGVVGLVSVEVGRPHRPRAAFLDSLHVRPGLRGGGLGGKLMVAAADQLQSHEVRSLSLEVLTGNLSAIAFYRRLGGTLGPSRRVPFLGFNINEQDVLWDDLSALVSTSGTIKARAARHHAPNTF